LFMENRVLHMDDWAGFQALTAWSRQALKQDAGLDDGQVGADCGG
jgi:hypothetical protein